MAFKRFAKLIIYEGEEDRLRSAYADLITSGGTILHADGTIMAVVPISNEDLFVMHPKAVQGILKKIQALRESGPIALLEPKYRPDSDDAAAGDKGGRTGT